MRSTIIAVLVNLLFLPAALASGSLVQARTGRIANTIHNLSVSGPGEVKSRSETEICKFCHIPHHPAAQEKLWSQPLSQAHYETPVIRSESGKATPAPQPDGASRLCLSCHDGTVAIGNRRPGNGAVKGGPLGLDARNRGFMGTDLSGSHPISFAVTESRPASKEQGDMGLRPLSMIRADQNVRLDSAGKMQCTSCHDPHDDRNFQSGITPHFLVKSSTSEVCQTCHELR